MAIKSLNSNDKVIDLGGGDVLSPSMKKSLVEKYNSNITINPKNKLGYNTVFNNYTKTDISVIGSAHDISGNGGRKIIRLNNGILIIGVLDFSAKKYILYKSTNNGDSWSQLYAGSTQTTVQSLSIDTDGTYIYVLFSYNNANVMFARFDQNGNALQSPNVDIGQTLLEGNSLKYSPKDNTLHATWSSKNGTYSNSVNMRYAKGTIANDGSITWGGVVQLTTLNTSAQNCKNPSISLYDNSPRILFDFYNTGTGDSYIFVAGEGLSGSTVGTMASGWGSKNVFYGGGSHYIQYFPSSTVDENGVIHVVWYGLDTTDTSVQNIRYSKSTDGGATWSAMQKLTSGNTYNQTFPSITYDSSNNIYVYWNGVTSTSNGNTRIRSIFYSSSWSGITDVTTNTVGGSIAYPSLCDNYHNFTSPLAIWQNNVSPSIRFSGTWTEEIEQTPNPTRVTNKKVFDTLNTMASDSLTETQKTSLLTQYNNGLNVPLDNQLGYKATYGTTTNPNISDATVVASAYDTGGNGRKLIRLKNGSLASVVRGNSTSYLYKNIDNGASWTLVGDVSDGTAPNPTNAVCISKSSSDNIYIFSTDNTALYMKRCDKNFNLISGKITIYNTGNTSYPITNPYSIIDQNNIHLTFQARISSHSSSFNIFYVKGVIASDGSVTWSAVEQVTTISVSSSYDRLNPVLFLDKNGIPCIITNSGSSHYTDAGGSMNDYAIQMVKRDRTLATTVSIVNSNWSQKTIYNSGSGYLQQYPSAIFVPQSINGLANGRIWVAWHGTDATDTTANNIRVSYSDDGGVTWSAMTKLTSGNTYANFESSITANKIGEVFVLFRGAQATTRNNIYQVKYTGTWSARTALTNNASTTQDFYGVSTLFDLTLNMTSPLFVYTALPLSKVGFYGTWTNTPIISESIDINAVANRVLIDAVISKGIGGKKFASGTITNGGTTQAFQYAGSTSTVSSYFVTVTGLAFKPSLIYLVSTSGSLMTIYSEINDTYYPKTVKMTSFASTTSANTLYNFKGDVSPASVTNGGFTLPTFNGNTTFNWIAFE